MGAFGGGDRSFAALPSLSNLPSTPQTNGYLVNGIKSLNGDVNGPKIRLKLHGSKQSRFGTETPTLTADDQSAVSQGDVCASSKILYPHHTPSLSFGVLFYPCLASKTTAPKPSSDLSKSQRNLVSFAEAPAIIRTPQFMKQYYDLDYAMQPHLDTDGAGPSKLPPSHRDVHFTNACLSLEGNTARLKNRLAGVLNTNDGNGSTIGLAYTDFLGPGSNREKRYDPASFGPQPLRNTAQICLPQGRT